MPGTSKACDMGRAKEGSRILVLSANQICRSASFTVGTSRWLARGWGVDSNTRTALVKP